MTTSRTAWAADGLASVVVFLVALPLCMGIAIASGVPPAAGLMTGIVGGLVVGFLAGSPLQVSGPAAGLAVIVWRLVETHGLDGLGLIVLAAGALQLLAGTLRLGQWFRAVSPAVIQGMLAGIGVLIFASQFHVMIDDRPRGSGLANLLSIPEAVMKAVVPTSGSSHHIAAAIGVSTVVVTVLWAVGAPKRLKFLPGPLVGVVVTTCVAASLGLQISYVDVPADLSAALTYVSADALGRIGWSVVLFEGVALAFIASAESLLCATAVDQMHDGVRTNYDRELRAQGIGNLLCGIVGALPMTGVIVRSTANVAAGAKSRRSAILHGVWILALVVALPGVLRLIPTASLAGILVYTGYKLVNPVAVRKLGQFGRREVLIYLVTTTAVVTVDLLTGVVAGIALALATMLVRLSSLNVRVQEADGQMEITLEGAATFLGLPRLARALEAIPSGTNVRLHVDRLSHIDHACLELLSRARGRCEAAGGVFTVEWDELLQRSRGPG